MKSNTTPCHSIADKEKTCLTIIKQKAMLPSAGQ